MWEFFQIRQRKSTLGREVVGGLTTFMAMSYILFVQPAVLGKTGMDAGGVFMATCLASAAACLLMGLLSNYPIALAPGMGENFFFVFTLCGVGAAAGAFRLTWAEALGLTAAVGVVFVLLSTVGLRSMLLNAIPDALKSGIAAGIGLFIALIGFEWGNLVQGHPSTCLALAEIKGNYAAGLTLAGLGVTMALMAFRVRGAILIGILATTVLTWGAARLPVRADLGLTVAPAEQGVTVTGVALGSPAAQGNVVRPGDVLVMFNGRLVADPEALAAAVASAGEAESVDIVRARDGVLSTVPQPLRIRTIAFGGVVGLPEGLGKTAGAFWGGLASLGEKMASSHALEVIGFAFILLFMDLFDTVGTLVGVASRAELMRDGKLPRAERALLADAAGTIAGGCLGTSTVTSFIESVTGVASGARTGLAAIVTGLCMLAALLFQPLVQMIGGGVVLGFSAFGDPILRYPMIAPALIVVGAMMMRAMHEVQWDDITESLPAFLAMVSIPFTFSIATGIAVGFISYAFGKLVTGRVRQCPVIVYVFAALFVLQYAIKAML